MHRVPLFVAVVVGELVLVAEAMADGSYYQPAKDDMIEYCGGSTVFENWTGGEGE
jgi:hypothetical protein